MRPRSALKQLKALLRAPSFTNQEAHHLGVSSATLGHYVKIGELERISRGIYRAPNSPPVEDFRWEDLIFTIQRIKGGVICLVSALALYELTEEIPRQHWIAIRNETCHRAESATRVVRMRNISLGKSSIKIGTITVPIFDRERTIIDSFRYLSTETAIKALKVAIHSKGNNKIDLEKIRKYAKVLHVKIEPYILSVITL